MFEEENEDEWLSPDFKKRLAHFEQMYKLDDYTYIDSDEIEFLLDHLIISNQMKKAKWAAERALEHFPTNTMIIVRYAQILSMTGRLNLALKMLLDIEKIEANNVEVLLSIASNYSQLKQSDLAIRFFRRAFDLSSGQEKTEIAIDLAMEYENKSDYVAAIEVLNNVVSDGEINDLVVYELAHCYEKIGDYENAVKCFLDYIDEEPYSYTTWYNLGNVYIKMDRPTDAVWAYEYAILIDEEFIPALYNLANTFLDINEIHKALEYFNKCLKIDQEDPTILYSIGECYEELEEFEKAHEMYTRSAELMPNLSDAWLGKGIMNDLLGNHTQAIREILVAIEQEPLKSEYWRALGSAYENNGQQEEALTAYEKAIELGPTEQDIIIDYLAFLAEISIEKVFEVVATNEAIRENEITDLILCYCHWTVGNQTESMLIFDDLLENNIKLAKSLFVHFPEMETVSYFYERLQELDENTDNEKF